MKKIISLIIASIALSYCSDITDHGKKSGPDDGKNQSLNQSEKSIQSLSGSDVWVGAYLASYNHYAPPTGNWGNLPTGEIDWEAFTHLYYFALNAKVDGSLSTIAPYENMSPDRINAIISAAHNAGKPVIFTVGGWGNYEGFSKAISPAIRSVFISNLVATLKLWGFDGIDLDMEPIKSADVDNYIAFINELYDELQRVSTPLLSTPSISVATAWHADIFAQIHEKLDHINLMTYDLSGAWQGWESWHNSPVYNGGRMFQSNGKPLPSIEEKVKVFEEAGIPKSKLGVGIDFYGYVWSGGTGTSTGGVTRPNQSWDTAPVVTDNVPYHKIMEQYYQAGRYHWDDQAKAAYLSIDESGSSGDKFISYDDEKSVQVKFDYVRQKGLGGVIIWELSGGYRENEPDGERDKLLQAVKQAMVNDGSSAPTQDVTPPDVSISTPAKGATVSGLEEIDIQASDNTGVSSVNLLIDGTPVKDFSSPPYIYSWNTTSHPNHICTLEARASDAAGNTAAATASVTISNNTSNALEGLAVYEDHLVSPWINSSWSASVDFKSTEKVYNGENSIKVEQNAWGSLSLHSGNWGQSKDVDPETVETVEFAFYALNKNAELSLKLDNDDGGSFATVTYGDVPANQWVFVRIPFSELNPDNQIIHRVNIMETSGAAKTYYIDNIKLMGSGGGSSPGLTVPTPVTPANGETGVSSNPVLSWDGGSPYYQLMVATDASFQNIATDIPGLTASSYNLSNLELGTTYYWKVRGLGQDGNTGSWSSAFSFTTRTVNTSSYQNVYEDNLEAPWINASWSASVDFQNSEYVYNGSNAIKVVQDSWGSLSIHSGKWGQSQDIDPAQYDAVEFVVYTTNSGVSFNVGLANDFGAVFPNIAYGPVPANQWVVVRISMTGLNPDNHIAHRLNIVETSGSVKTYYVDDIRLIQKAF